ncbi:hypothetical protein VitviT2T_006230 [Vitis vinifera]|uniref:Uncharacterized protein n=1 Tax=Vitis vinifera TaxID=29760 RepID=A0ABY9BWZ9_VITVI|nr:hypothetical protein VitviT2T_006206 [Vitis vinifera]WJZ86793.1 hypothetical protein VitviT2T_006217 [Vitis vinifera]WJZ86808.1 hypothetical protein VitviT2T_006230 [Vitis vinifera]
MEQVALGISSCKCREYLVGLSLAGHLKCFFSMTSSDHCTFLFERILDSIGETRPANCQELDVRDCTGALEKKNKLSMETVKEVAAISNSEAQPEESENLRTSTVYDIYMGLGPKKRVYLQQDVQQKGSSVTENSTNDEVKRLAAAALSAVRMLQQLLQAEEKLKLQRYGTLRVEIEVKKLVDASEEASERAKGPAGTASAADHARQDKKGWG